MILLCFSHYYKCSKTVLSMMKKSNASDLKSECCISAGHPQQEGMSGERPHQGLGVDQLNCVVGWLCRFDQYVLLFSWDTALMGTVSPQG
jgi:hypothetical protein